ncbi:MAG: DNA methyltransferase [Candidatus Aenigmatarchaeota archaeon]
MPFTLEPKSEWGILATFIPNKRTPVYNWLYYKEGFSAELVLKLIGMFELKPGQTVLDPFCGVGTTLLACKQRALNAVGFDVMPVAVLASSVKTRDYDINKLRESVRELLAHKFEKPAKVEAPAIVKKCFSHYALEDIIFFRSLIRKVQDEAVRDFFMLGLVNAAMKVSWAWKDGGVIKVKKHPSPPLRKMLAKTLGRMIKDLEKFEAKPAKIRVSIGDARKLPLPDGSIDAVITSPPYLNQIDYRKVYAIENWIVSGETAPALRSFIGAVSEADAESLKERNLPAQAQLYFLDMNAVLAELWRVCKPSAKLAMVIGNAYFPPPHEPVESDVILAELAEKIGFTVDKILVLNQRAALRRRTEKVGLLRESLLLLEKR